ncbi:MAG: aminoacyl-histidine dipeptidase [Firmicutes bacterium]|nr:aminoacyl-histidine dipeptidase [Bacillota bacterium]
MTEYKRPEPNDVFRFFEEIARIPHGSYNTKQISDYLAGFAKERGLRYVQDELNNVIIYGPATEGYEDAEPVILQGHMDMVCEKETGLDIDMSKEGIKLMLDGEFLTADGTTLGGDDGIAVAMMLALLDSKEYRHPALECVFTVDEETGLEGAEGIDVSNLKGKRMINIDSEEEGIFTVSCAGGSAAEGRIPVTRVQAEGEAYVLRLNGLLGGHSGMEIDKERANSNIEMGRILSDLSSKVIFKLVSFKGGAFDNAIPKDTTAEILVTSGAEYLESMVADLKATLKNEYHASEPGLDLELSKACCCSADPLDSESTSRIIAFLLNVPDRIINMSMDIKGLPEVSLNLGVCELKDFEFATLHGLRGSVDSRLMLLQRKLTSYYLLFGGTVEHKLYYPGWEYKPDSPLRDTCVEVFKEVYGKEPLVLATHAGLECGFFAGKMGPDFDAVSIGPDMFDVHSPNEKLSIPSTQRTWNYLLKVLEALK